MEPPDTISKCREPLRATLLRTVTIAAVVGAALALGAGHLSRWPAATLLALWPALGGHFVELFFLNALRPRLPASPLVQVAVRVAVWFAGGALLALGMTLTARALPGLHAFRGSAWRIAGFGGVAFIAIELTVHIILHLRGRPNFYDGRS